MRTVRIPLPPRNPADRYGSFSVVGNDAVAVLDGSELRLLSPDDLSEPMLVVPDTVGFGSLPSCVVVLTADRVLHRYEHHTAGWHESAELPLSAACRLPEQHAGERRSVGRYPMTLSLSGRYARIADYLVDVRTGDVVRHGNVYGTFATLFDGRDVLLYGVDPLFIADSATGTVLATINSHSWYKWSYFKLLAGGTHLFADTYDGSIAQSNLYDVSDILSQSDDEAPPRLFHHAERALDPDETVTEYYVNIHGLPAESDDGTFSLVVVSSTGLPLPEETDEELLGLRFEYSPSDREIYATLRGCPSETVILLRRVSSLSGEVTGWSYHPIEEYNTGHTHVLRNHRVVLLTMSRESPMTGRIRLFDGLAGELHDLGPFDPPLPESHKFETSMTPDGETMIVCWREQ